MKRIGLGIVVLASSSMLLLGGCVNRDAQAQAQQTKEIVTDQTVPVVVAEASSEDVAITLELTGSLVTDDDVAIAANVPGRLVSVFVRDGQSVKAGQVIAQQDTTDARTRLKQAQAQVSAARSQLAQARTDAQVSPERTAAAVRASESRLRQAEVNLQKLLNGARVEEKRQAKANLDRAKSDRDTAKKNLDRSQRLYDQGAIAKAQLEADKNRYQSALAGYTQALEQYNLILDSVRPEDIQAAREQVRQAREQLAADKANQKLDPLLNQRVDAARANLDAAQESVALAQNAISDLTIRASMSGKVSGKPAQPGTYLAPGVAVARLIGVDGVFYEAEVTERDVTELNPGMSVAVTVDALSGAELSGTVVSIDPLASNLGRLYRVRVELSENLGKLKPGMFAKGVVRLGVDEGAITIPSRAVLRDGELTTVFVVEDGKSYRKSVTVKSQFGLMYVVEGLSAGEQVVVNGQLGLIDGSDVRIDDPESGDSKEEEGA